ncbi:ammonium transporter [Desulfothermus okinawensis JCM 13304]
MILSSNTCWLLICSALVMLMTPGLALFYGGLVRNKNVLNTTLMSFICLGIISVEWFFIGYSMSFGKDVGGIIGGLNHIFLAGVGLEPSQNYATTIPHALFMLFQMMFAIITPALISGAIVERMKFSAYVLFVLFWAILVYNPLCHWVWGKGGWMAKLGILDFAGGIVVHISAGISALVAALVVGKRKGYPGSQFVPHNLPLAVIGAGLLWFGWFGFNAGSALGANKIAVLAAVNTHIAGAAAAVTWIIAEWYHYGKPSTLGVISGLVAGLATITPASGFVPMWAALIIGLLAGIICYTAVVLKVKMGFDDSLDAFSIHGIGGIFGTISLGIFAKYGATGLIYGNFHQFLLQVGGALFTIIYCGTLTFLILKILDLIIGIRSSEEDEVMGLDLSEHGEEAYKI